MGLCCGQNMIGDGVSNRPKLHVLFTCPFCWKVRGLVEHLKLDVDYVSVNGMRIKKDVAFAGDWGKVPVLTDEHGEHFVDSTPLLKHIDATYNGGEMARWGIRIGRHTAGMGRTNCRKQRSPFCMAHWVLALKTTTRISRIEKFGFFSRRLYAGQVFQSCGELLPRSESRKMGESQSSCGMIC